MRRPSHKWLTALAAALFIPALLIASGANAAGKIADPCLDTVAGTADFVTEVIDGFSYTDDGVLVVEESSTYSVTWNRSGLEVDVYVGGGCTAAEAGNYRLTLAYPDGRTIATSPTSVTNDPTGAATRISFDLPQLEVVSDSAGKTESRGFDADRVFAYVETIGDRGQVVDRGPDSGANEICVSYQSTDSTAACYHSDGGGSGYWN